MSVSSGQKIRTWVADSRLQLRAKSTKNHLGPAFEAPHAWDVKYYNTLDLNVLIHHQINGFWYLLRCGQRSYQLTVTMFEQVDFPASHNW